MVSVINSDSLTKAKDRDSLFNLSSSNRKSKIPVKTTSAQSLRIMIISFNMGNAKIDFLENLIPNQGANQDMICLGFQESVYSDDSTSMMEMMESRQHLESLISDVLIGPGDRGDFYQVANIKRAQMQMFLYLRKSFREHVGLVEKTAENTGTLHVFPNKGGIAISVKIFGSLVTFISSHLAAHEGVKKCHMRNSSVEEILGGVRMVKKEMDPSVISHHTFFSGDMNYRITFDKRTPADLQDNEKNESRAMSEEEKKQLQLEDEEMPNSPMSSYDSSSKDSISKEMKSAEIHTLIEMISRQDWPGLLRLDELNRELAAGRVLRDFTAMQPHFPPTFKRLRDTSLANVDLSTLAADDGATYYSHKRLPSYTDRVLYKSLPGFANRLTELGFESCENVCSSDHKPVRAYFLLTPTEGADGVQVRDDRHGLHGQFNMRLRDLKGRNLKEMDMALFGGKSDPYIVLHSDPPELLDPSKSNLKSTTIHHNINPDWPDVLDLIVVSTDYPGISENAHLFLSVWDYDLANSNDLIGTCVIPFSVMLDKFVLKEAYQFDLPLYNNGLCCGQLQGTASVVNGLPMSLAEWRNSRRNRAQSQSNSDGVSTLKQMTEITDSSKSDSAKCSCSIM